MKIDRENKEIEVYENYEAELHILSKKVMELLQEQKDDEKTDEEIEKEVDLRCKQLLDEISTTVTADLKKLKESPDLTKEEKQQIDDTLDKKLAEQYVKSLQKELDNSAQVQNFDRVSLYTTLKLIALLIKLVDFAKSYIDRSDTGRRARELADFSQVGSFVARRSLSVLLQPLLMVAVLRDPRLMNLMVVGTVENIHPAQGIGIQYNRDAALEYAQLANIAYEGQGVNDPIRNRLIPFTNGEVTSYLGAELSIYYTANNGLFIMPGKIKLWFGKSIIDNRICIAFAGTDSLATVYADLAQIAGGDFMYRLAAGFVMRVADIAFSRGERVIVLGHSLGGGLTQFSVANFLNKKHNPDTLLIEGYGFNSAGLFEETMLLLDLADGKKNAVKNKIIHICASRDPVSTFGSFLGRIHSIGVPGAMPHSIHSLIEQIRSGAVNALALNDYEVMPYGEPADATSMGLNISFGINLTLLKTDLTGQFELKNNQDGKRTSVLVLPTSAPNDGMKLTELIVEVNKMIKNFTGKEGDFTEAQVKDTLAQFKLSALENVRIVLKQVYIFYDKLTKTVAQGAAPVEEKNFEYAFSIEILNQVEPAESMSLFQINSLSFSIWNTTRPKILNRMALGDIQALLSKE